MMTGKLQLYSFMFITNLLCTFVFTITLSIKMLFAKEAMLDSQVLGLSICWICLLIFFLHDYAGINLVKKCRYAGSKSAISVFAITLKGFFQLIATILSTFGVVNLGATLFKIYITRNGSTLNNEIFVLFIFICVLLISITGIFNFFSTIYLYKKIKANHIKLDSIVENIGT